jgi:sodium/proline symporter
MAWIFFVYLATLLALGTIAERRTRGLTGFLLGDRRVGPWATALSYEATAYSGWLMLGFPGRAFSRGLAAIWIAVANVLGDALNWVGVARHLREQTSRLGALTIPEYLEQRFARDGGAAVRVVASTAIVIFMLIYLWAQCVAAGKTLAMILGTDYQMAAVVSAAVIIVYTFQGGYRAVVWTDCVQATMVVVALVALPLACLYQLGGFGGLAEVLRGAATEAAAGGMSAGPGLIDWFAGLGGLALFTMLFEDAGVGLGYLGQPHTCARFMAIRGAEHLRAAFVVSIIWAALVCSGAAMVGLVAHGWFRAPQASASAGTVAIADSSASRPALADPEEALPRLAIAVFPEWLAGFVIAAIMAPIMSSSAGFLFSAASSMSKDVYPFLLRRRSASEGELIVVARVSTLAIGVMALALALATDPLDKRSAVYALVLYAWGGLSGCFSATVLLALYYRGMTRAGCLAGMIVGSATTLAWHNDAALSGVAYEVIPAFVLSATTIVLVSRLSRPGGSTP